MSPDRSGANTDRLQKPMTSVNSVAHHADSSDSYSSGEDATETESDDDSCSSHKLLFMPVSISHMKISALLDTGSSVNIMSSHLYNSLPKYCHSPLLPSNFGNHVVVASGDKIEILGTSFVKMKSSTGKHKVKVLVMRNTSHPLIFGTDYLRQKRITTSFATNTVHTSDCSVRCNKSFEIPANNKVLIFAKVPNSVNIGTQGICYTCKDLSKEGLIVARAVVTVSVDHLVPLKVMNVTDSVVVVPKRKNLARFTVLDDSYQIQIPCNDNDSHDNVHVQCVNNVNTVSDSAFNSYSVQDDNVHVENMQNVHDSVSEPNFSEFIDNFDLQKSCSHLNDDQISELSQVLYESNDIFVTKQNPGLGFTTLVEHHIHLKPDAISKHQRPHRLSPDKKEILRHHLQELLDQGIITPVSPDENIPITSPVVLVSKRRKSSTSYVPGSKEESLSCFRFCCDFRYLNSQVQHFRYTFPDLQELTESFTNRVPNFISTIDLSSGFFQMGIAPESTKYTAFNTCFGSYKFLRLPMGLSTAPNSFQLLMDKVLNGLTFKSTLCYLDDVVIVSDTFSSHMSDLTELFNRFRSAGLKLNPSKCMFSQKECVYLGHMISKDGLSPPPDRVQAIQNYTAPTTVKELRRFLGLVGWFRKFIPNFASVADPLYFLLKKGVRYTWTNEHQCAFEQLKSLLVSSPVLAFPQFDRQFRLGVDTSSRGIGFMLYQSQPNEEGTEEIRVVRFGSKSLSKWQRSYGPTKLELLGMTYAVLECASYLRGSHFIVECDHQALKPLYQKQLKGAIYERWMAILQEFTFDIVYKPAKDMCVADALSRVVQPCDETFDSPDVEDYFFPYVAEKSGQINFPDGTPFRLNSNESEVNHIQLALPDIDDGYDADTDDNYGHLPGKHVKRAFRPHSTHKVPAVVSKTVSPNTYHSLPGHSDSDTMVKVVHTNHSSPHTGSTTKVISDSNTTVIQTVHTDHSQHTSTEHTKHISDSDTTNIHGNTSTHLSSGSTTRLSDTDTVVHSANGSDTEHRGTHHSSSNSDVTEPEGINIDVDDILARTNMSLQDIAKLQHSDPNTKSILDYLEHNILPASQKLSRRILLEASDYLVVHDTLFHTRVAKSKRTQGHCKYQLVLPDSLVKTILQLYHETPISGHGGITDTLDRVKEHYFFPRMAVRVSEFVASCHQCQSRKMTKLHTKAGIVSYPTPQKPFDVWQVDLLGPFPTTYRGNAYICTATCMFSKYKCTCLPHQFQIRMP